MTSINVKVRIINDQTFIPAALAKLMLGGKWPKSEDYGYPPGFDFESIDEFLIEDGELIPMLLGSPMDGPNLILDAVPNPLSRISVIR